MNGVLLLHCCPACERRVSRCCQACERRAGGRGVVAASQRRPAGQPDGRRAASLPRPAARLPAHPAELAPTQTLDRLAHCLPLPQTGEQGARQGMGGSVRMSKIKN